MDNRKFYTIYGWMLNELKLKGTELEVFAVIYSFSSKGKVFTGSLNYLASCTGTSKNSILRAIKSLVSKGFITKKDSYIDKKHLCEYKAIIKTGAKTAPGGAKTAPGVVKKLHRGGAKTAPGTGAKTVMNINSIENIDNTDIYIQDIAQEKHIYGRYQNVELTDEQYIKLGEDFSPEIRDKYINRLSGYIGSTGKHYADHDITIRNFIEKDVDAQNNPTVPPAVAHSERMTDFLMSIARGDIEI